MTPLENVRHRLMKYMGSFAATPQRVFTVRDFNSQVMMHSFSPEDRVLDEALADLVSSGVLEKQSPTEYTVTARGQQEIANLRSAPERSERR